MKFTAVPPLRFPIGSFHRLGGSLGTSSTSPDQPYWNMFACMEQLMYYAWPQAGANIPSSFIIIIPIHAQAFSSKNPANQ